MTTIDWRWVLDPWTPASHKKALGDQTIPGAAVPMLPWTPLEDQRRIVAYKLYEGYYQNAARHWLASNDPKVRNNHREYGDAAVLVDQTLAALIGSEQTIVVAGAEKYDPTRTAEATVVDGEVAAAAAADAAPSGDATGGTADLAHPEADPQQEVWRARAAREDWLREWATLERFTPKLFSTELNAVKKGDGVYVLGWNGRTKRAHLKVYDPDVYFPVPDPDSDDEDATVHHLVWVYKEPRQDSSSPVIVWKLRRITWRLKTVPPWRPAYLDKDDPDSTVACFMSDGVWNLNDGMKLPDMWDMLDETGATWRKNAEGADLHDLDIGIDFIPIEHIPNTINETAPPGARWGQPVLAKVLQVLDDVAATDTDFASATATTGAPPIALSGVRATKRGPDGQVIEQGTTTVYGPGQMYHLGENGKMDVLDTSRSLDALDKAKQGLLDRMTANARMSAVVMGRISPEKMASGMQLQLSLGPMQAYMAQLRLVRDEKYPRLLAKVQKFAIANGVIDAPVMPARLTFGNYLPADKAAAVALVRELATPVPIVSRLTLLRILINAGFPIDDAAAELKRLQAEDFLGAVALGDALGNQEVVASYLGKPGTKPDEPTGGIPTIPVRPDLRGGTPGNADTQDLVTGSHGRTQPPTPSEPIPAGGRR